MSGRYILTTAAIALGVVVAFQHYQTRGAGMKRGS